MLLCKFCKRNYAIQSEPNSTNYCSLIKLNKCLISFGHSHSGLDWHSSSTKHQIYNTNAYPKHTAEAIKKSQTKQSISIQNTISIVRQSHKNPHPKTEKGFKEKKLWAL